MIKRLKLFRRMRASASRTQARRRFGTMYLGAVAMQGASILVIALHGRIEAHATDQSELLLLVSLALQVAVVACLVVFRAILIAKHDHEQHMRADSEEARRRTAELFTMTDMLQAAETNDEAAAVLMVTARRLLPGHGAALYVLNSARDRLDLARSWDMPGEHIEHGGLAPGDCWAIRRGKTHLNAPDEGGLCCAHHNGYNSALEIPLMAGGHVQGLLIITNEGALHRGEVEDGTTITSKLGQALADSMSLALSNIALRDKLRVQSLRDPLTGLYNRRYMEDTLERFLALASRGGGSTAVIMIDLDNFKALNDDYGHAKGDAVLRDVSAQIIGALRPADVVCRYGGEEIVAILPDCPLDDAASKAEQIRLRIHGLSEAHGCAISASIGVSALPETSARGEELIPDADAVLYMAKASGKNRVIVAERIMPRVGVARIGAVG